MRGFRYYRKMKLAVLTIICFTILCETAWGQTVSRKSGGWKQDYNEITNIQTPTTETSKKPQNQPAQNIDMNNKNELFKDPEETSKKPSGEFVIVSKSASNLSNDQASGPGATKPSLEIEETEKSTGPTVYEVEMDETYHEDFEVYTESLEGRYFIYSNIGNMGITDQPVYVDFPGNIQYSAEKDGFPYSYTSKELIRETGTYVFYITAIKDSSVPLSEQVIYETTFNFRIQPKPEKKEETTASFQSEYGGSSFMPNIESYPETEVADSPTSTLPEETLPIEENPESILSEEESETATVSESESETSDMEQELETPIEKTKELYPIVSDSFDPSTGMYSFHLGTNATFLCNVPNGMITNVAVMFDFSGLGNDAQLVHILKNGEEYLISEDGVFIETGTYHVFLPFEETKVMFSFKIIGTAVSNFDVYTIPVEMELVTFSRNEENLLIDGKRQLEFQKDGYYILQMQNELGALYGISFTVDHEPPVFTTNIVKETVQFTYKSNDISHVEVEKDGKTEMYESLFQLSGSGTYLVRAVDHAGNIYEQTIIIPKTVNMAGVLAVVLIIALVVAAVLFIKKTKRNFHVT